MEFENCYNRYVNCVSLGWYCGTSSACSRLGLRSFSGPFDWILSDLEYVIKTIDEEFSNFLNKKNLKEDKENSKCFYDIENKFYFPHDITTNLDDDFLKISDKYHRRINNFIEQSKKPTCYFRIVKDQKEIDYIESKNDYIDCVLKKKNDKNNIIYLLINSLEFSDTFKNKNIGKYYKLCIDDFWKDSVCLRATFSKSESLLKFCNNILSIDKVKHNLMWDKKNLSDIQKADEVMIAVNNNMTALILWLKSRLVKGFYIWGSGKYGTMFVKFLKQNGFDIKAVIDNDESKWNKYVDGVEIISFSNVDINATILISIADNKIVDAVKNQILQKGNFDICTILDLYNACL